MTICGTDANATAPSALASKPASKDTEKDRKMAFQAARTIPELAGDSIQQLAKLIGNEFDLARAELSEKAAQAGRAAAMIGAGAIILIPALVVLLFAVAAALMHAGLSDPVAYAVTGGVAALIALVLILVGISRLSADALKPKVTLEQVERDKLVAREMAR
jgi:hypothetical protein